MHFSEVNECGPLSCLARKALICLERWMWLLACALPCWFLWWTSIVPPSMFISGRVFGKCNDDFVCHTVAAAWAFSESFWTLQRLRHSQQLEKCCFSPAASSVVLNKEESKETSSGLRARNSVTSRNTISAEVWWMMSQKKEALSNLKEQDWTNLRLKMNWRLCKEIHHSSSDSWTASFR